MVRRQTSDFSGGAPRDFYKKKCAKRTPVSPLLKEGARRAGDRVPRRGTISAVTHRTRMTSQAQFVSLL